MHRAQVTYDDSIHPKRGKIDSNVRNEFLSLHSSILYNAKYSWPCYARTCVSKALPTSITNGSYFIDVDEFEASRDAASPSLRSLLSSELDA